jgi:hypothetical protein
MSMSSKHSQPTHDPRVDLGAAHAHEGAPRSHESSEIRLGPSLRFAAALAALCIAAFFAMRWLMVSDVEKDRAADTTPHPLAAERQIPSEPQLQSMPGVPLVGGTLEAGMQPFSSTGYAELAKKQEKTLTSYGWIDRQAGVVHIPIERAIELVLKQGLPTTDAKSNKR